MATAEENIKWAEQIRIHSENLEISKIVRRSGLSERTVRTYLKRIPKSR